MFKVGNNSGPKTDFRCLLRCARNHAPFIPKPDLHEWTESDRCICVCLITYKKSTSYLNSFMRYS